MAITPVRRLTRSKSYFFQAKVKDKMVPEKKPCVSIILRFIANLQGLARRSTIWIKISPKGDRIHEGPHRETASSEFRVVETKKSPLIKQVHSFPSFGIGNRNIDPVPYLRCEVCCPRSYRKSLSHWLEQRCPVYSGATSV